MKRLGPSACLFLILAASSLVVSCAADLALRKERAEAHMTLGEGYLGARNFSAALGEFLEAEKLNSKDPYVHYDLGLAYFGKKEFELAIVHLNKAVELKPGYAEAFNAMGTVYLRLEKWNKAISQFERASDNLLYATPYIALNNIGDAYRGKKDLVRAINFYEKALEAEPYFPNAHRGMGLVLIDMGDYEGAVASLKKAVKYAPGFAPPLYELGKGYALQFETEKAVAAFKKVIALAPDSPLAASAQVEIRKLGR